jgi:YidC/Oxa1 family membrane protein insertase
MEQARLFTAIVLSFIVLFAWNYFFIDKQPLPETAVEAPSEPSPSKPLLSNTVQENGKTNGLINKEPSLIPDDDTSRAHGQMQRTITVDTPLYSVQLSNQGAIIKSMTLKNYREHVASDALLKEMVANDSPNGTLHLSLKQDTIPGLEHAVFTINADGHHIDASHQTEHLSFTWHSPDGIIIQKTYTFKPDTYLLGYTITLFNKSRRTVSDELHVSLVTTPPEDKRMYGFEGPFALIDNRVEKVKIKKIEDNPTYSGKLKWIAVTDRYFMSSIIPVDVKQAVMHLSLEGNILKTQYRQPTGTLLPDSSRHYDFQLYMGPKSVSILKEQGHDLKKAVDFGFFDFLAKPFLLLMNIIYQFIPNYGVAIIILTILIKIVFWPLGTKSYLSMNEMKKLQPLMAEIREKHKNDKQKMNAEIMNLYKTYKVNPVSGCLPIIVQMPIFFALYRMLYEAIELRHAPFIGWINDLSAPDRLLHFDFAIPFMQPPYGIPVLTIIMGATMFLQQKLSPQAGDPTQAKMMMFMPLIFTVIFINFSSGLVLYWLVNNILSIAQQYYVVKKNA